MYASYHLLPEIPVLPEPMLAPAAMMAGSHSARMTAAATLKCLIVLPDEQVFLVLNHTRWQVALGHSCC